MWFCGSIGFSVTLAGMIKASGVSEAALSLLFALVSSAPVRTCAPRPGGG